MIMTRNPKPSPVKEADDEVKDMCQKVKQKVEEKTSRTLSVFTARSYRTLVVYNESRIIVFIKVQLSDNEFMHLRIFRRVPSRHGEVTLEHFLDDMKDADPLEAFQEPSKEETKTGSGQPDSSAGPPEIIVT